MGQRDVSQVQGASSAQGMVCTPFVLDELADGEAALGVEGGDGIGEVDLEVEVVACTGELHDDAVGSGRNVAGRIRTLRVTGALLGEAGPGQGPGGHVEEELEELLFSLSSLVR